VEVSIEALQSPNPVAADKLEGVSVHYCRETLRTPLRFSAEMRRRVRRLDQAILHGHGLWQCPVHYAMAAGRRQGIPTLLAPRGMLEPGAMRFSRWKKTLAGAIFQWRDLRAATCLHATADAEAATLRARGLRQPICVIPNGIPLPPLPLTGAAAEGGARHRRLAFLSRIHPKKNLPMLLTAWRALQADFPGWRLQLAGTDEGGHEADLKRQARQLGIEDSVQFLGPLYGDDKHTFLCDADLFVLPTLSENFGMVVAEALARGTPVITTKGAPWRVLEERHAGWWIDIDEAALTHALRRAMALSDAERHDMGRRGRQLVEERFSVDHVGERMLRVYEWLAEKAERPACVSVG
jgi:glycosyltransferase involved in cell wall biosynthesis